MGGGEGARFAAEGVRWVRRLGTYSKLGWRLLADTCETSDAAADRRAARVDIARRKGKCERAGACWR